MAAKFPSLAAWRRAAFLGGALLATPAWAGNVPVNPAKRAAYLKSAFAVPGSARTLRVAKPGGVTKAAAVSAFGFLPAATTGVVLDHSLGQTGQPTVTTNASGKNDYGIPSTLGKTAGSNLFFSFSSFNLDTNESATFSGPDSIANILARVTGGPSSIDGVLRSQITGANLYLLNPAGVLFGPNAKLDLSGSLTVSTANTVRFQKGKPFDTTPSARDSTLSSAAVASFGFTAPRPAPVQIDGSTLTVLAGKGIRLSGGRLILSGAKLSAPGGKIALKGHGAITIQDASRVGIDGSGGGLLSIEGPSLTLTGQSILASNDTGSAPGGNIRLTLQGLCFLGPNSSIDSFTLGTGRGGNIAVQAGSLVAQGAQILAQALNGSNGDSGSLLVRTRGAMQILAGADFDVSTFGLGRAGTAFVQAGSLLIDGLGADQITGITGQSASLDSGRGGSIQVAVAGALSLVDGGFISASTFSPAPGGDVSVRAGSIFIDGRGTLANPDPIASGILANSEGEGEGGPGGRIVVQTPGLLRILGGGEIVAGTLSSGAGGDIAVSAGSIEIDGTGAAGAMTGIGVQALFPPAPRAGSLMVQAADSITLRHGATISADSEFNARGGNVTVVAPNILIDGTGFSGDTAISANADFQTGGAFSGTAGNVRVVAANLTLLDGGNISSDTYGRGAGGQVSVQAGTLTIDGRNDDNNVTSISSYSDFAGRAGDLLIDAGTVKITRFGEIAADTNGSGRSGDILLQSGSLVIDGGGIGFASISTSTFAGSTGEGGSTTIQTGDLTLLRGGNIESTTAGAGRAGDVHVSASRIDAEGLQTDISASTDGASAAATAGSVRVSAGRIELTRGASIASSALGLAAAGSVRIGVGTRLRLDANATVSTSSANANAGDITITSGSVIELHDGGRIEASAGANGGSITLQAQDLVWLEHSQLTATAGTSLGAGKNAGAGGNITIDPTSVILDHALISANAAQGRGGNISLTTDDFFVNDSLLTATGAQAGTIHIVAPELDLANSLATLPGSLLDASTQLRDICAVRMQQDFSSFLILGAGGVAQDPDQPLPSGVPAKERKRGR